MASILIQCAEAVKEALADHDFAPHDFEPRRSYADWALPLTDTTELLCDVVPVGRPVTEIADGESINWQPAVDVVLRQKFDRGKANVDTGKIEIAEVDSLVELVEAIHDLFAIDRLPDFDDAACEAPQILMAYSPSHLRENLQFTAIIRIPFIVLPQL